VLDDHRTMHTRYHTNEHGERVGEKVLDEGIAALLVIAHHLEAMKFQNEELLGRIAKALESAQKAPQADE